MSAREDAVAALADTLDAIDAHLRVSDDTVRRSERNRLSLLHVHAAVAVLIGPLFAAIGREAMSGATWGVARLIPGAPETLGALLFAGGAILAVSTILRAVVWEMVGLSILLAWYLIIAVSFGAALALWIGQGAPAGPAPSLYAPFVYAHLAIIMGVHLRTLWRIRRTRRRP